MVGTDEHTRRLSFHWLTSFDCAQPKQFTCGGKTSQNETTFVNPGYPRGDNGTDTCQVTIEKSPNVCQLRLDFEDFTLAQPDENGLCTTDSFMVRTTVGERLPIICGENSGHHSKYLEAEPN